MKIRYTPFSEAIGTGDMVKGLEFADDVIRPYFIMSLRYNENYYGDQPVGNTIHFMNFPECSLLFYFAAGARSYRVNGFIIGAGERQKAWVSMLPLIQSLRRYPFSKGAADTQFDENFLENLTDLEEAAMDELLPFHFIISSMPYECLPECDGVRVFNRFRLAGVERSFQLVTGKQIGKTVMPLKKYDIFSNIFWMPPGKMSKKWYMEYYTGIIEKKGRNKEIHEVLRQETGLLGTKGCCSYEYFQRAVMQLID